MSPGIIGVPPPLCPVLPIRTVAVIVPVYNAAKWIAETLTSLMEQTCDDWICAICDDGSTDDSLAIVRDLVIGNPRHHFVVGRHPENRGQPAARNTAASAIETARPKWILPLDADDKLAPTFLETMLAADDGECGWIIPYIQQFGDRDEIITIPDGAPANILIENRLCGTSLIRKALWDELGGNREDLTHMADWDFWCRATMAGHKPIIVREPLFLYRRHPESQTRNWTSGEFLAQEKRMRAGWAT